MYKWVLEERLSDEDFNKFSSALNRRGIPFEKFNGLFNGYSTHIDKLTKDPFYFHGTISGALLIRNEPNYAMSFTPRNYNCSSYYPYFQSYLLNGDYQIYQMRQIPLKFSNFNGQIFVRPDSGLKNFAGSVLSDHEISGIRSMCSHYEMTDLVITATPKKIDSEWRLLFRQVGDKDFKYITGSLYYNNGDHEENPDVDKDLINYTTGMLNVCNYSPDPIFYADMALVAGKFALNELTAFCPAGVYACNINKIIDAIQEQSLEEI